MVAGLGKAPGMWLDMSAFADMARTAKFMWDRVGSTGEEYGERAGKLTGYFEDATDEELRALSMWQDIHGVSISEESCLHALIAGRQLAPLPTEQMRLRLDGKRFSNDDDKAACVGMYSEALAAVLGYRRKLSYKSMRHWSVEDWSHLGAVMSVCEHLQALDLQGNFQSSEEWCAFTGALAKGSLPSLVTLDVQGHASFDAAAWDAIRGALRRGAMPRLRYVETNYWHADAWEGALSAVRGLSVARDNDYTVMISRHQCVECCRLA